MPIKKTRELNDTAAIQSMPIDPVQKDEYTSLNVRKIDNGYLTRTSSNKDGQYSSSEVYSKDPPQASSDDAQGSPMARALRYLTKTGTV